MRKISGSEAFKAPMCMLFNMSLGPPVGTPLSVRAPLEPIKGRVHTLEHKLSTHTKVLMNTEISQTHKQYNTRWTLGFTLRQPEPSKPLCASRVHTPQNQAFLDLPQTHPKLGLGGCTPPPGWRNPPTEKFRLPYLTLNLTFIPYLTLPFIPPINPHK
jgi:hypothetical protein